MKKRMLQLPNGFRIDLDSVPAPWVIQWLKEQEQARRRLEEDRRPRVHIEVGNQGPEPRRSGEAPDASEPG